MTRTILMNGVCLYHNCCCCCLHDSRDNFVRDLVAILLPILAILFATTIVVTKGSIGQENGKVEHIKVGTNQASVPCGKRPTETS